MDRLEATLVGALALEAAAGCFLTRGLALAGAGRRVIGRAAGAGAFFAAGAFFVFGLAALGAAAAFLTAAGGGTTGAVEKTMTAGALRAEEGLRRLARGDRLTGFFFLGRGAGAGAGGAAARAARAGGATIVTFLGGDARLAEEGGREAAFFLEEGALGVGAWKRKGEGERPAFPG